MVLYDYWISWIQLSLLVVDEVRLFIELMHLPKATDRLSWRWNFLVDVLFDVTFFASSFSLLFSSTCRKCTTLTAVSLIHDFESGFLLVVVPSFSSFTLFCLSIITNSLFISWWGRRVLFCTVSYASAHRRMFLDSFRVLTFSRMITIGSLVLVVRNLIVASVSSEIRLITFEDVCMEGTHACVFVIMLGGLRESRRVLAKLSLMIFPADTVKVSHVLTRTEFMWWGWNLVVP